MIEIHALSVNCTPERLGLIPFFLDEEDSRSARLQFDAKYIGGWEPQPNFKMLQNGTLTYPNDPPLKPLALMLFRDEKIYIYDHAYVAVVQPDGSFEACRMD